jgi:hypothetical protein
VCGAPLAPQGSQGQAARKFAGVRPSGHDPASAPRLRTDIVLLGGEADRFMSRGARNAHYPRRARADPTARRARVEEWQ